MAVGWSPPGARLGRGFLAAVGTMHLTLQRFALFAPRFSAHAESVAGIRNQYCGLSACVLISPSLTESSRRGQSRVGLPGAPCSGCVLFPGAASCPLTQNPLMVIRACPGYTVRLEPLIDCWEERPFLPKAHRQRGVCCPPVVPRAICCCSTWDRCVARRGCLGATQNGICFALWLRQAGEAQRR